MICSFPARVSPKTTRPCGKCHPCRENRRRKWLARLEMEAKSYPGEVSFHTLTYSEEHLPRVRDPETGEVLGTLKKVDLQEFVRRIRRWDATTQSFSSSTKIRVRYYACAEYGTKSGRPHYHLILFGLDPTIAEMIVQKAWEYGFTSTRPGDRTNMRYTLKYVLKNQNDPESPWLRGRLPTFALMSTRPPIGTSLLPLVARMLIKTACDEQGNPLTTFPTTVRIEGEVYPLDRTMLRELKKELQFESHQEAIAFPKLIMRERTHGEKEKAEGQHYKAERAARSYRTQNPV